MVKKKTLDDILKVERLVSVFSKECAQLVEGLTAYHNTTQSSDASLEVQEDDENEEESSQKQHQQQQQEPQDLQSQEEQQTEPQTDFKFYCTSCNVTFSTAVEHRLHYKMDWHRFNAKQKSSGKPILTEDTFEAMLLDDCSSISGSDSESDYEDTIACKSDSEDEDAIDEVKNEKDPLSGHAYKIFLVDPSTKSLVSVYRNTIANADTDEDILRNVRQVVNRGSTWFYAMLSAGHFAAAVFHKNEVVAHKTFHRYTVRAKQGTSQGDHDKKGGQAKSAGASIRRHNETALVNEIQELLLSWRTHLTAADKIFIKCAPSYNHVFFNEKSGSLRKGDGRIARISIMTRRPTLKEVKRLHLLYTNLYIHGPLADIQEEISKELSVGRKKREKHVPTSCKKSTLEVSSPSRGRSSRSPSPGHDPSKDPECVAIWNKAYEECQKGNLEELTQMLGNVEAKFFISDDESVPSSEFETREYLLKKREFFEGGYLMMCGGELRETLLHCAAKSTTSTTISFLMGIGCDPTVRDKRGRLPYNIASCKENRNEFRRFMGKYASKYDYASAQIPSALTQEAESLKKEKEAEKKRQQNKARKQRQKVKKAEEYKEKEIERERKKEEEEAAREVAEFKKLSVREKCAMMAERRMADEKSRRCSNCKTSLDTMVPFERFEYKYCSTDCVHKHKDVIGK